jgi:excisionase family DNA binding protein
MFEVLMKTFYVPDPSADAKLAVSTVEAARLAGVGRTTIYQAIQSGALKSLKLGKRRLIRLDALKDWLAAHEAA